MDALRTQSYRVVGGPLDGETVSLPVLATDYIAVRAGGQGVDRYVVEEWTQRDEAGRALWTGLCLVWAESAE
jgi:hypothetical protein